MNKKYIYAMLLAASTSVFTACQKDKLNPLPQDVTVDVTALSTPARVLAGVNGLYATARSGSFLGGRYQVMSDIRGNDFQIETSNLVTGADVYQLNLANSATNVKVIWSQAYFVINRCNVFLDGMAAGGSAVVGNATTANAYIAEARFLRAISYYSLLQLYAKPYADNNGNTPGLPLRLKGNTSSGDYSLARSTVAQVYDQILADLNFAETNAQPSYSSALLNTTRAHKNTVLALKTRVLLSMQRYADVVTEANKIVPATAPFKASSGVPNEMQADVKSVFTTYTTVESVFSMPFVSGTETPGTQNQLGFYYYQNGNTAGVGEYAANNSPGGIVVDPNFKAADKRKTDLMVLNGGKYWVSKWPKAGQYEDYAPVIRWPEVLLNLAEARARVAAPGAAPDVQALALLNAVHRRSDAATTYAPATNAELIDLILTERRIELIGEGFRTADIMRLRIPIPAKPAVLAKAPTEAGYIWPISSDELSLNRLMTDN